jgi:hypothetical protein
LRLRPPEREEDAMPTYEVPDIVEVDLEQLILPTHVPVDSQLNEKPLAECTKEEVEQAVKAFTVLARHTQKEIEELVDKHVELRRRLAHLQAYLENFDRISWVRE